MGFAIYLLQVLDENKKVLPQTNQIIRLKAIEFLEHTGI
jgi:hypothetical protein